MLKRFCFLLCFLFSASFCFAQAPVDGFYRGQGALDIVMGGGIKIGKGFYAGEDEIALKRDIINVNAFLAYGILDNLDVNISIPYLKINAVESFQDGSIYLKAKVLEGAFGKGAYSLSLAAGYSLPLAAYETEGGSAIGQEAKVIDLRPVLHYQWSTGWFATAQAGYQFKSDPTPDSFSSVLKTGLAGDEFYFDCYYAYQQSDGGLDYRGDPMPLSFRELGVDYHKVGVSIYKPVLDFLGFSISGSYAFAGRNTDRTIGINAAAVFKLDCAAK